MRWTELLLALPGLVQPRETGSRQASRSWSAFARSWLAVPACGGLLMLAACNQLEEMLNKGTTAGFAICMARGKAQGLTDATSKTACIAKHEKPIAAEFRGAGSVSKTFGSLSFEGTSRNISKKYIITRFTLNVTVADKNKKEFKKFEDYWILPNENTQIFIALPGFEGIDVEVFSDSSKWGWYISDVQGIEISL